MKAALRIALVALGLTVLLALSLAAFGMQVQESLWLLFEGAFGDRFGVARSLSRATPLLLAALGTTVAWRAGMYNIGGEGQLVVGALGGAWLFHAAPTLPGPDLTFGILVCAAAGGAAWAGIAGWLQVRRGVPVVISTILMNFVAIQLLSWAASGPLQEAKGKLPVTERLPADAMLPRFDPQSDLHAGIILALVLAILTGAYLFRTVGGYRLRLVGESASAARSGRVVPGPVQLKAMLLSGALCGLAGGVDYTGIAGQLGSGFSQGWGFVAIPTALLGGLSPMGVVLSSGFFGALFAGSDNLAGFTTSGATVIYAMQGVAVLGFVWYASGRDRANLRVDPA